MAGAPLGRIEVEFSTGVWTNVTAYQLAGAITVTGGRPDTGERVMPGRLTGLRLNNTDGRFTVGNTSSPYYPNVTSGKQIRVSIKDPGSAVYYPRFTGRVEGWPLSWEDNGETCVVSVTAVDLLNDWAVATMPNDWMFRATAALATTATLVGYWACTSLNADGAMPPSAGGGALRNAGQAPTALSVDTFPGDAGKAFPFTYSASASTGYYWGGAPAITSNSWGVSLWVKVTEEPGTSDPYAIIIENAPLAASNRVGIRIKTDGIYLTTVDGAHVVTDRLGPIGPPITDGSWRHVVLKVEESAGVVTASLGLDGGDYWSSTSAGLTTTNMLANRSARLIRIGTRMSGSVCHVAMWSGVDSAPDQWRALMAAGLDTIILSSPTNRLDQLAAYAGLPAPVSPGPFRTVLAATTPFGKALDLVRPVEDTDGGVLWCEPDGDIRYSYGLERKAVPTLSLTLTADEVSGLVMAADRATMANEVTVTSTAPAVLARPDLTTTEVTVRDSASIAAVGRRTASLNVAWTMFGWGVDPGFLYTRAGELLQTSEAPRIPSLTVDALTLSNAQQLAVLKAQMWRLIALTGLPSAGGMPTSWLGRIEGWTEVIDVSTWQVTYSTSFAGARVGDSTFGRVGSARLG